MTRTYTATRKLSILRQLDETKAPTEFDKIMAQHNLSNDELIQWRQQYDQHGFEGLKVSKRTPLTNCAM